MLDKENKQERSKQHSESNAIKRVEERNNFNERGRVFIAFEGVYFRGRGSVQLERKKIKFEKRSFKS